MSAYSFLTEDKTVSLDKISKNQFHKTPFVFIQETIDPRKSDHVISYQDNVNKTNVILSKKPNMIDYDNLAEYSMKGVNSESSLSIKFFSQNNKQVIQEMIKNTIYDKSKGKFNLLVDQDDTALTIVMRKVFLRESVNLLCDVDLQVEKLNMQVVNEVFPDMMSNIRQEIGYLKVISEPITPIPLPLNVSNAGRKTTLPSVTTTF